MNKIFTTAFFLLSASTLFAQNKITYKVNGLNAGDVRAMEQVEFRSQGDGGANQVWDFSDAKVIKPMVIEQAENVAVAVGNLDLTSRNTLLSVNEGGEKTTFFEITNSQKRYWGLTSGLVKIEFNQPIVDMTFPMAYQDEVSGVMDGTYSTGSSVEPIKGTYTSVADAWGSLVLPDGQKFDNVLRVKLSKSYQQTSGSLTYTINTVRYQYYAEGVRYPVFIALKNDVSSDCNCTCGQYTTELAYYLPKAQNELKDVINGSSVAENNVKVNVFPNPFKETLNTTVNVAKATDAEIDLLDVAGRLIKSFGAYNLVEGENDIVLDADNVVPGSYYIRVRVDGVNYAKVVIKK